MLSTVIRDSYQAGEAREIADALEEICSPERTYGWASAGIYCFWDLGTRQPLYIGLAVDLGSRFQQHNGLVPCDANACKRERIEHHLNEHGTVGYSILVQSPLDQPIIARNALGDKSMEDPDILESIELVDTGRERIVLAEGTLIEACVKQLGVRPPWNKIGGSAAGQKRTQIEHYDFVRWLVAQEHPPFIARRTLRQISADATEEGFEEDLHAVRMRMMMSGLTFRHAVEWLYSLGDIHAWRVNEMISRGYLTQKAPFEV